MELKEAFINRFKSLLKERGMTQYELSKRTGMPQSTISTIVKGNVKTVQLFTIYQICCGLNIEFSDLFDVESLKLRNLDD